MSFRQSREGKEFEIVIPRASLSKDNSFGCSEYRAICAAMLDVISPEMRVEDTCELDPFAFRYAKAVYQRALLSALPLAIPEIDELESLNGQRLDLNRSLAIASPFPTSAEKFERIFAE